MTDEAQQLKWNGTNYECEYGDGRTLYVSGDDWGEARMDRARELFKGKHPELTEDQAIELLSEGTPEGDACFDQATKENLDPFEWGLDAVQVDADGEPLDPKDRDTHLSAWIQGEITICQYYIIENSKHKHCTEPAEIECRIGTCFPLKKYCGYHYEQEHLPESERDEVDRVFYPEQAQA